VFVWCQEGTVSAEVPHQPFSRVSLKTFGNHDMT